MMEADWLTTPLVLYRVQIYAMGVIINLISDFAAVACLV